MTTSKLHVDLDPELPLTQRTIPKLFTPRILAGFKLHCNSFNEKNEGQAVR
jgi:hypothetical protein